MLPLESHGADTKVQPHHWGATAHKLCVSHATVVQTCVYEWVVLGAGNGVK